MEGARGIECARRIWGSGGGLTVAHQRPTSGGEDWFVQPARLIRPHSRQERYLYRQGLGSRRLLRHMDEFRFLAFTIVVWREVDTVSIERHDATERGIVVVVLVGRPKPSLLKIP